MIFLILSITFISVAAVIFRWSADEQANALEVNAVFRTFGCAAMLGILLPQIGDGVFANLPAHIWVWSVVGGLFYWLAGYANLRASGLGHLGITWTVSRSAMVVPAVASMLVWQEVPLAVDSPELWLTLSGIVLTLAALVGFGVDRMGRRRMPGAAPHRWYLWLVASFCCQGTWELTLRASGGFAGETERLAYVTLVFAIAMVLSLGSLAARRRWPSRKAWKFGLLAGVCTVLGTGTRPWALRDLPGVIVFPVTSVAVILLTQGASAWLWKTRLGKWGWAALVAAVVAVILLGLGQY